MTEVTLHPQTISTTSENEEKPKKEKIILSPSVSIDPLLFAIDPLLLIKICSFLDMLSVMKFECVSLRLSKFLKRNIKLQSLHETNTDYLIDNALKHTNEVEEKEEEEEDKVKIEKD
eukprot:456000_1